MKSNPKLNHSASHLLAAAILKLYPNTKLAIGPAIEEGFYYDFEFENPLLESDLPKIEKWCIKLQNKIMMLKNGTLSIWFFITTF